MSSSASKLPVEVSLTSRLPTKMTRTKLLEERHKEKLPHISYDLDNDGYVGGRDYVVAKRFDKGNKNFLTEEERAEAYFALKNGYEDNFTWDVEASGGGGRPYRLMQKRGVMVDAEDFGEVTYTYPRHPMSDIKPHVNTNTELIALRKLKEKNDIGRKKGTIDAEVTKLQKIHFKDYYQPQEYVANPKYFAMH